MNKFSAEYYSLKALKNLAERTSENDTKSKELGISQLVIKVAQEETAFATGVHAQIWDDALAASDMSDLINREKATAKDLVTSTLWEEEPPKWFQSNWPSSQTARDEWSFWVEWYQGFLDGKPLDWELQYRLSLINDAIWEAGPEAVAKEIEKVRAKFDLGNRVAELETDLRRVMVNRHGIGGNMPPEILDDRHITQEMVIFPQPIEDLKDEIAKDDLDPKRLQKIIDALVAALKEGVAWCLRKGDLIVDTAIKWAIPTGGTGYIALNPEKLEAVIEAAKKLLSVH